MTLLARPAVHVTVLAALAAVFCLVGVARQPLDGDSAMYATIAKTIATTGQWTHLTINGDPYLNKPPLHFWLNALVFRTLPATTFTASLAPGLLGVAGVLLLYAVCRATLGGWETAFAAGLVYLTTPEVLHWSRGVHLETLVTFWILIGLLAAYRSVADPAALLLLGVAAAGGWLAKGPQGLFPVAVAAVLWAREGVLARRLLSAWAVGAAVIALAATAPWFWARLQEGSGFGRVYFADQIGGALFSEGLLHRGPFWYVSKLLRTYWPWLPVTAVGLVLLGRQWKSSLGARLWLVYAAIVMIVISLAVGKKSRYLFQLYPAFAVAAGVAVSTAARRRPYALTALSAAAAAAAVLVAMVGGERASSKQTAHARDALAIAAELDGVDREPVWITRGVQHGEPQLGKIVGFYARALLRTCRATCEEELSPGSVVVTRADEAAMLAARSGGAITVRTTTLAIVRVPALSERAHTHS